MTTSARKMVPLPADLVARLDEARGASPRPVFLEALLEAYERGELVTAPTARRRERQPLEQVKPSECRHPPTRQIGTACALCGAPNAHPAKAKR